MCDVCVCVGGGGGGGIDGTIQLFLGTVCMICTWYLIYMLRCCDMHFKTGTILYVNGYAHTCI